MANSKTGWIIRFLGFIIVSLTVVVLLFLPYRTGKADLTVVVMNELDSSDTAEVTLAVEKWNNLFGRLDVTGYIIFNGIQYDGFHGQSKAAFFFRTDLKNTEYLKDYILVDSWTSHEIILRWTKAENDKFGVYVVKIP